MIEVFLGITLGIVLSLLALVFWQLWALRHQLSDLRVQMATFRLTRAEKSNGDGRPPEPPEGTRRKGNLWVVPFFLGLLAGLGRWLRRTVSEHPVPAAAVGTAVVATAGGALFLGGAFSYHHGGQVALPPTVMRPPSQTSTPAPGSSPPRPSASPATSGPSAVTVTYPPTPGPSAAPPIPLAPVPTAPATAPGTSQPPPAPAPSTAAPTAAPAPSAAPAAPPPAVAPAPTPAPTSSGLCLRVVVDPLLGTSVCILP